VFFFHTGHYSVSVSTGLTVEERVGGFSALDAEVCQEEYRCKDCNACSQYNLWTEGENTSFEHMPFHS